MLINFIFATAIIATLVGVIVSLDKTNSFITEATRKILRVTYRSRLLTEYILRAYLRYKRAIQKPIY